MTSEFDDRAIAITGLSCRLPGAPNPDALGERLKNARHSFTDLTDAELLAEGVTPETMNDPRYVRSASVLDDIAGFDAAFFGFSDVQAELIDPQQRLFFECAWEAFEEAGGTPHMDDRPASVGVFAASSISGYLLFNLLRDMAPGASPTTMTAMVGNEKDYLASQTAWLLGLHGPTIGVQTACSSSLVAVHLACQSLTSGECDMALAGGVNVRVPHRVGHTYEEGSILSPTGRCRSFEAHADGTVFGSGVGVVALKRLSDALADGDRVHAVIRGSAVNNDGRQKAGFTAPGLDGQAAVIAEALAIAAVAPETIGYIEAHGTGTPIGDPIELRALNEAFGGRALGRNQIALGTIKSLMGHLETAAGVTGLIAAVLAVRDGFIPPLADFGAPNPLLDFAGGPFAPATPDRIWPSHHARRAGVSSFGIGGTNAHVVLDEAPPRASALESGRTVLSICAHSASALASARADVAAQLRQGAPLQPLARASLLGPRQLPHRIAIVAESSAAAVTAVENSAATHVPDRPNLAMLFTGQGALRPGLGEEVSVLGDAAAATLEEACRTLPAIRQPLFDRNADLADTAIAQPALYAIQWALVAEFSERGVHAEAHAGHSVGEFAAAAAAGVFSWAEGLQAVARRGAIMSDLPPGGAMVALAAPAATVDAACRAEADVALAAINGPRACVISGAAAAVERVVARLAADGVASVPLAVSHAFHSPLMDPALDDLQDALGALPAQPPSTPLVSTLTGDVLPVAGAAHWRRHTRDPVRFGDALASLERLGSTAFLEIGPGATLSRLAAAQCPAVATVPALSGGPDLLDALASLHANGIRVDWRRVVPAGPRAALPRYPYQRKRHWRTPSRAASTNTAAWPGRTIDTPLATRQRVVALCAGAPAWLGDHRVDGAVVMPGAAFLSLALHALGDSSNSS